MLHTWLLKIQVYLLKKPKFRKWATLEDRKYNFIQAVEDSIPNLPEILYDYLSTALYFRVDFERVYWEDVLEAFYRIHGVSSQIKTIPLTASHDKGKSKKDPWDYSGRLWYMYASILASAFGWSEKAIANLDVDSALSYIQEILTGKQLDQEFIWSTTELSYEWNKATKKSKFRPLARPYWMRDMSTQSARKPVPVPKSLLPVGNIIRLSESYEETKKTPLGAGVEAVPSAETGSG